MPLRVDGATLVPGLGQRGAMAADVEAPGVAA
jgi:hypothetical protein